MKGLRGPLRCAIDGTTLGPRGVCGTCDQRAYDQLQAHLAEQADDDAARWEHDRALADAHDAEHGRYHP